MSIHQWTREQLSTRKIHVYYNLECWSKWWIKYWWTMSITLHAKKKLRSHIAMGNPWISRPHVLTQVQMRLYKIYIYILYIYIYVYVIIYVVNCDFICVWYYLLSTELCIDDKNGSFIYVVHIGIPTAPFGFASARARTSPPTVLRPRPRRSDR